jgi:hypothetical protein
MTVNHPLFPSVYAPPTATTSPRFGGLLLSIHPEQNRPSSSTQQSESQLVPCE